MKIQLEIDDKDLAMLIDALKCASSKADDEPSFNAVKKVITGIKSNINIAVAAFNELKGKLAPFTDGSPVLLTSDFRTQLGIPEGFIKSDTGLIVILNYVLKFLIANYKPEAKPNLIKKAKIDDARTIQDLVNIILANYESSK